MTKQNETKASATAQAIQSGIMSEGNAGSKVQPLINATIKAGDKAAFVAVAMGLSRLKDTAKGRNFLAILRTRLKRGCKANEMAVFWTVKKGEEGVFSVVVKDFPAVGGDDAAKLRKALDLVKQHVSDPAVAVELMSAIQSANATAQQVPAQVVSRAPVKGAAQVEAAH